MSKALSLIKNLLFVFDYMFVSFVARQIHKLFFKVKSVVDKLRPTIFVVDELSLQFTGGVKIFFK